MRLLSPKKEKKNILKGKRMSDLDKYIAKRKKKDADFADGFEIGYQNFKIGVMFRHIREKAGLTQEELADRINTGKSVISKIENHAEDICLSVLGKYVGAFGKNLNIRILP